MAYGRKYEDSPYAGVGKAYKAHGQRQQQRRDNPQNERNRRIADIMRMASQWAPAVGGTLGAIGGAGVGALAGGVPAAGTGPFAIGPAIAGGLAGAGAGATMGSGLGTAVGSGLQGMSNEVTMPEQESAAQDAQTQLLMQLLMAGR